MDGIVDVDVCDRAGYHCWLNAGGGVSGGDWWKAGGKYACMLDDGEKGDNSISG